MSKISYSAWKKYLECPKKFEFHYKNRLRPVAIGSPLVFGIAVDNALNDFLTGEGDLFASFRDSFKWEDMENVEFTDKDLQWDVFSPEQQQELSQRDVKYQAWACLRVKGRLLLEAYRDIIYPQIEEVHSVQEKLESRPGVLDAVLTIRDHGMVLIDHKTSSMPYQRDAIQKDTQLALYSRDRGIDKIGFAVLNKKICFVKICTKCGFDGSHSSHKTCPKEVDSVRCHGKFQKTPDQGRMVQLLIQDAPKINQVLIESSINDVEKAIKANHFPRNLNSCHKMYGKPCPYFNKCWKNNEDGLEIKEEK